MLKKKKQTVQNTRVKLRQPHTFWKMGFLIPNFILQVHCGGFNPNYTHACSVRTMICEEEGLKPPPFLFS